MNRILFDDVFSFMNDFFFFRKKLMFNVYIGTILAQNFGQSQYNSALCKLIFFIKHIGHGLNRGENIEFLLMYSLDILWNTALKNYTLFKLI